jgi:DNA-binding MarR family transcriptional regulator
MGAMATNGKPDFGILLLLAEQEFIRELRATTAAQGFADQGRSDGFVLRTLGRAPATISTLATRLDITKQGAAQIIDDMEHRGYVERHPDPTDGRARLIHLSPRGQAALAVARRFHQTYERRLRKAHGDDAINAMRAVFTAMAGEDSTTDPHFRALMF